MRLLTLIRHAYRALVPEPFDPRDLSAEDVDQIIAQGVEDLTGRRPDAGSVALNLAALRKRRAYLERQQATMSHTAATQPDCDLAAAARELATLRTELAECDRHIADLVLLEKHQN